MWKYGSCGSYPQPARLSVLGRARSWQCGHFSGSNYCTAQSIRVQQRAQTVQSKGYNIVAFHFLPFTSLFSQTLFCSSISHPGSSLVKLSVLHPDVWNWTIVPEEIQLLLSSPLLSMLSCIMLPLCLSVFPSFVNALLPFQSLCGQSSFLISNKT